MEPRGSNCGMCGVYVVMPTPHIYKNGEMNQRPVLLRPLPGLPILSEVLGNLILCLVIFPYLLNISLYLLVKNSTMAAHQSTWRSRQFLAHNSHGIFAKWGS